MKLKYPDKDYMSFKMRILSASYLVGESLVHRVGHFPMLLFCVIIPFFLPCIIAIISLFMQVKCLVFDSSPRSDRDPAKVKAAVTIFLLTLVFSVSYTSCVSFWLSVCLNPESTYLSNQNAIWVYVTGVTMTFLNSAISPTILICRGNSLKNMVSDVFKF
jgi:hypothetical protein